jgi:HEAT repeat protein
MTTPSETAHELVVRLGPCLALGPRASTPLFDLASVLSALSARDLPPVDAILRSTSFTFKDGWYDLTPTTVSQFAKRPEGWSLIALAGSHRSGFVRQASVRALGQLRDGRAVPYIVLRLNDWVPEVRQAAQAALTGYLSPSFGSALVDALPLIFGLEHQRRADHAGLVAWVLQFLRSPACKEALAIGCGSHDRDLRRLCLRMAAGAGVEDREKVLGAALSDPDPTIRAWAVDSLGADFANEWARNLAGRALADRSVQVRRVALRLMAQVLTPSDARKAVEEALLDENSSARWQARIIRLAQGPIDLAEFYRRALSNASTPAQLRGALLGLGESGTQDDRALVLPFVDSDRVGVRRAALRALSGIEPIETTELFWAALLDRQPGVSKEGLRALQIRVAHVLPHSLLTLVGAGKMPAHARRNALSLGNGLSKWESLPILLEAAGSNATAVAERGLRMLDGWHA